MKLLRDGWLRGCLVSWGRIAGWKPVLAAVATVVCTLVIANASPVILDAATLFFYFLLLAASWNLLAGFCGQMSFAHVGFAVAGAYVTAWLTGAFTIPTALAVVMAACAVGVVSIAVGLLTLRFRSIVFALATFAFAGVFKSWLTGATEITGGSNGMAVAGLFGYGHAMWVGMAGLGLCVIYFTLQALMLNSRLGVLMRAVRDRQVVAEGLGVDAVRVKLVVFTYTAFWAGLAGGFYGSYTQYVTPSIADLQNMGLVLGMAIVGGLGTVVGPIVGTVILRWIEFVTQGIGGQYTLLIFAMIVLFVMLFFREGVVPFTVALARRLWVSRRKYPRE